MTSRAPGAEPLSPERIIHLMTGGAKERAWFSDAEQLAALRELHALRAERTSAPASGEVQESVDAAAAALLIELAFLVPKGTNLATTIGPKLEAFKAAIEARALVSSLTPQPDIEALVAAAKAQMHGWSWPIPKAVHDLVAALARVPPAPQPVVKDVEALVALRQRIKRDVDVGTDADLAVMDAAIVALSAPPWQALADEFRERPDQFVSGRHVSDRIEHTLARVTAPPAPAAQARSAGRVEAWQKVETEHPEPHARYVVRRDGHLFIATPCYGMHAPWWVPDSPTGETEPIHMQPTDEWAALQRARETGDKS